jgi:predicted outer membrane repeat protein
VAQSYSDSSFQNGGAIAATGGGKINVYASKFNGNYAYGRGGGIYSENTMNIVSSVFTANWASFAGGGVYVANKPATLYNLTFVDNRAYIQGGGGIYNVPTDSQLYASIFRNNIGLYPVNKASAAEWTGNQGTGVTDQINSVNGIIATNMHYVDMCPVISYEYGKGVDGADAGVCNGSSLCGSIPTALKAGSIPASLDKVSLNRLAYSYNECSTSEFVDCNAPTYSNCSPQNSTVPSSESIKTGSPSFCLAYLYSSTYSPPYKKDFAGNKLASASGDEISLGAYQCTITCPLGTDLREDQCCLSIHKNTCYDCSSFNPSGTCPSGQICSSSQCANSCSSSNPKGACPSGTTCYSGKCAGSCSSSNPSGFCPSGQKCLNGNCFSLCNKGETCPSGKTCLSGVCL